MVTGVLLVRVPTSHVPYGPEQQAVPVPAGAATGGGHRLRLEQQLFPGGGRGASGQRRRRSCAVLVEQLQRLDVEQGFPDEGHGSRRVPLAEAHEGSQPATLAGVFARVLLAESAAAGWLSIRP